MGRAPVGEEHEGEVPRALPRLEVAAGLRARGGDAVVPVLLVLDDERGEGCAQEVAVEARVVAPAVCVGVREDGAVDRGRGRVGEGVVDGGGGREGVGGGQGLGERAVPEGLDPEEELGDEVVVVPEELGGVVEEELEKKGRVKVSVSFS